MIILTSSIASVADHVYKNYLSGKGYKTILFIDTAAEPEVGKVEGDDAWLQADLTSLRNQGYQVDRWSMTGKTRDQIENQIDSYDVIYMCGGDTIYLLQQLQETKAFSLIVEKVRSGKPYIGTSAGSIIAGPKVPLYLEDPDGIKLDNYQGFGFTDVIMAPHWGSGHFKRRYLEGRLEIAYRDTEPPLLLLNDFQYFVVDGDRKVEIINTKN